MPEEELPQYFLRGISTQRHMDEDSGKPNIDLFSFQRPDPDGDTNEHTESINWQDDGGAIYELLIRKKCNDYRYKYGIAVFDRNLLDERRTMYFPNGFSYKRKPIPGNKYHGNLIMQKDIETIKKYLIKSAIVFSCVFTIQNNDNTRQKYCASQSGANQD